MNSLIELNHHLREDFGIVVKGASIRTLLSFDLKGKIKGGKMKLEEKKRQWLGGETRKSILSGHDELPKITRACPETDSLMLSLQSRVIV